MRSRLLIGACAITSLALGAPVARASHVTVTGGCYLAAATDAIAGEGQVTGVMAIAAVARWTGTPELYSGRVGCSVRVNGAPQPHSPVWTQGTGVFVGGGVITFTSNSVDDWVQLCQQIGYEISCEEIEQLEVPPPIVHQVMDPTYCAVLALAAPGVGGVVGINSEGDVWVGADRVQDCPPYNDGGNAHLLLYYGPQQRAAGGA